MQSNNNIVKIKTHKYRKPKRIKIRNLTERRNVRSRKKRNQDRMLGFGQTT